MGLSKAIVSDTRSGSHKMLYQHFQVMRSTGEAVQMWTQLTLAMTVY